MKHAGELVVQDRKQTLAEPCLQICSRLKQFSRMRVLKIQGMLPLARWGTTFLCFT